MNIVELNHKTREILLDFGISPSTPGFHHLRYAILCAYTSGIIPKRGAFMRIYQDVVRTHNRSVRAVERRMRYAVMRGLDTEVYEKYFGNVMSLIATYLHDNS